MMNKSTKKLHYVMRPVVRSSVCLIYRICVVPVKFCVIPSQVSSSSLSYGLRSYCFQIINTIIICTPIVTLSFVVVVFSPEFCLFGWLVCCCC